MEGSSLENEIHEIWKVRLLFAVWHPLQAEHR